MRLITMSFFSFLGKCLGAGIDVYRMCGKIGVWMCMDEMGMMRF